MSNALTQSAVSGCICAIFGMAYAFPFLKNEEGEGTLPFWVLSGLTSFVVMAPLWWALVARMSQPAIWRGALTGVIGVLIIHYAALYAFMLTDYINFQITGTGLTEGPPVNPVQAIMPVFALSLLSYLLLAWFTVPTGAVVGALYIWILRFFVTP